tara:strand:+ start:519 stop:1097 length:579 start_codon:yes stop_codon:yes gene_type:complete
MDIYLLIVGSYLIGSVPFGYILTKFFLNKDIRKIGSGNIGATNVLRTGNKIIGYATLLLDVLKAVFPIIFIKINYPEYVFISALSVFIGHVFPVWLKFRGGKGVATYVGILCCINIYLGISFGLVWLITFLIFKYSSLSSLIGSFSIPIINFFIFNDEIVFFFIIMFVLIFYTHRQNIKRLLNHTESKTKIY